MQKKTNSSEWSSGIHTTRNFQQNLRDIVEINRFTICVRSPSVTPIHGKISWIPNFIDSFQQGSWAINCEYWDLECGDGGEKRLGMMIERESGRHCLCFLIKPLLTCFFFVDFNTSLITRIARSREAWIDIHLAVIMALNSLKSTWLSPFTSAWRLSWCYGSGQQNFQWTRIESALFYLDHHFLDLLVREVDTQVRHDSLDLAATCKPTPVLVKH